MIVELSVVGPVHIGRQLPGLAAIADTPGQPLVALALLPGGISMSFCALAWAKRFGEARSAAILHPSSLSFHAV